LTNAFGTAVEPFGYPAYAGGPFPPQKLSTVGKMRSLTEVWFLVDADQVGSGNGWLDPASGLNKMPPKPVHGSVRNYGFFDGHVTAKKIGARGGY
jgi:prepilin-type processing-associated H-X9-DG protein